MKRSFTLIELMVSVVIFSIGIVLVLQSFLSVERGYSAAESIARASIFIDEKFSTLEEESIISTGTSPVTEEGVFSVKGRDFNWQLNIEPFENQQEQEDIEGLLTANLNVTWIQGGRQRSLEGVSYYSEITQETEE